MDDYVAQCVEIPGFSTYLVPYFEVLYLIINRYLGPLHSRLAPGLFNIMTLKVRQVTIDMLPKSNLTRRRQAPVYYD